MPIHSSGTRQYIVMNGHIRKESHYKKKLNFINLLLSIGLILVTAYALYVLLNKDKISYFSILLFLPAALTGIKHIVSNIIRPIFGVLILDDIGIRLDAGPFSWKKRWDDLDAVYFRTTRMKNTILSFYRKQALYRDIEHINQWHCVNEGKSSLLFDEIKKHLPIKPDEQRQTIPATSFADLGRRAAIVTGCIAGLTLIAILLGNYVHRFYALDPGVSTFWLATGGLVTALTAFRFTYRTECTLQGTVIISLLAAVPGALFAAILAKSYVITLGQDQLHTYTLEIKNGGYQRWESSHDPSLTIELGSVNNNIHTQAKQGAELKLTVRSIDGQGLKLLLPDELGRTRYGI